MGRIEAVIFDWAGTTIDFGCMAPVQAFIDAFSAHQIEITLEEARAPMGMSKRDHVTTILTMPLVQQRFHQTHQRSSTAQDIDIIYEQFEKKLFATLMNHTDLKPHLLNTIEKIKAMGIKIGSTTGYNTEMMEVILPAVKANGYMPDCWYCSDHVGKKGRPYPYMIFRNMEHLNVSCVHAALKIGDTQSDIEEGQAANVRTVAVLEGSSEMGVSLSEWLTLSADQQAQLRHQTRQAFVRYGADFIIDDLSQLPTLIQSLI